MLYYFCKISLPRNLSDKTLCHKTWRKETGKTFKFKCRSMHFKIHIALTEDNHETPRLLFPQNSQKIKGYAWSNDNQPHQTLPWAWSKWCDHQEDAHNQVEYWVHNVDLKATTQKQKRVTFFTTCPKSNSLSVYSFMPGNPFVLFLYSLQR